MPETTVTPFSRNRKNRLELAVAAVALGGASACVVAYVLAGQHSWERDWAPGLGASLLIGGLGLIILNVLIEGKLEEIDRRRYQSSQHSVAMLLHQLSQWLKSAHEVAQDRPATGIWPQPLSDETLRDVKRWLRRLEHLYAPLLPPESWQVINDIWLQVDRQLHGVPVSAWANTDAIDRDLEALRRGFLALASLPADESRR